MKKKNDIVGEQEFEKHLKEKMNELSSSVKCFNKISSRAFPEKDSDFSDSEFTVSDLENVTGRRKAVPVLKWTAVAAAIVLFVGILPQTAFVQEFLSNLGRDRDNKYRSVLAEISRETSEHTYKIYDMTLEDYIKKDVLVTPFYSCPFCEREKEDINVRVYVRTLDDIPTNQIYAVEYAGDYSEANILAAAESKAKFTDEDVESIDLDNGFYDSDNEMHKVINSCFMGSKRDAVLDSDGNAVYLASFSRNDLFKLDDTVYDLTTDVIYYRTAADDSGVYYYDIRSYQYNNGKAAAVPVPESDKLWKRSLNFDGSSAMPKSSASLFNKKELLPVSEGDKVGTSPCYYMPYANTEEEILDGGLVHMEITRSEMSDENTGIYTFDGAFDFSDKEVFAYSSEDDYSCNYEFDVPADRYSKERMKIYISGVNFLSYSSYSDAKIVIRISGTDKTLNIRMNDICHGKIEEAANELYNAEIQSEIAKQQQKLGTNMKKKKN